MAFDERGVGIRQCSLEVQRSDIKQDDVVREMVHPARFELATL